MTGPAYGRQTIWTTAVESAYGTAVTCDRSYEILPTEGIKRAQRLLVSNGMRGGSYNLRRGSRRAVSASDAGGDVELEVATTGFGRQFKQIFGSTTGPTQIGGSTAYTQVHSLGSTAGLSQTVQRQLRDANGSAISTLTYKGSKVDKAEFSCSVQDFLKLKMSFDSQVEVTNIAAAAAAYPSVTTPFTFQQANVFTLNGTPVANVLSAKVALDRKLKKDRFFLGSSGLKGESLENDFPDVTGEFQAEVLGTTLYDAFVADTPLAMVLTFTGGAIGGGNNASCSITVPELHLIGETPTANTAGILTQAVQFEAAADPANDAGISLTYISTDTTL